MHIETRRENGEVAKALRAHVERPLRLVLGRFGALVGRVMVRLAPPDGMPRGTDIRCRIRHRPIEQSGVGLAIVVLGFLAALLLAVRAAIWPG